MTAMPPPLISALPPPPGQSGWPWQAAALPSDAAAHAASWPRITVVTPSYNQGQYLEAALRSVLLQGYPNLEYIVMDGGSRDDSSAVLDRYAHTLDYWVSEADRGQTHALNKGFSRATGEILGWLNSDDLLKPGALFTVARAFRDHPGTVLVYGEAEFIRPDGTLRAGRPIARPYSRRWLLEQSNPIPQPAAYFRASAFRAAGGLDEGLNFVMDWDLWLRLRPEGAAVFLPQVLAAMRLYPEAKFQSGGRALYAELRLVIERHGGRGLPASARQRLAAQHLALALAASARGESAAARDELAYVLDNEPALRADWRRLADAIAEHAWRLHHAQQADPLVLAERVCAQLPESGRPGRVRRRSRGRLCAARAFESYRAGRPREVWPHAWRAARSDPAQWGNRGLWAIAVRALAGRAAAAGGNSDA
jgi:hypothetical protein